MEVDCFYHWEQSARLLFPGRKVEHTEFAVKHGISDERVEIQWQKV
jgi:hypothetical protein